MRSVECRGCVHDIHDSIRMIQFTRFNFPTDDSYGVLDEYRMACAQQEWSVIQRDHDSYHSSFLSISIHIIMIVHGYHDDEDKEAEDDRDDDRYMDEGQCNE